VANVRSPRAAARLLVLGGLSVLLAVLPVTGAAADNGRLEQEPSAAELAAQQAQLAQLRADEKVQAANVDDAQQAVRASAALAGQALEDYSVAVRGLQARQLTERDAESTLVVAQQTLDSSRRDLGRWARQAYQGGTGLAASPTLNWMFRAENSDDVATDVAVLRRVGDDRGRSVAAVRVAVGRADVASSSAADASQVAATAAIQATDTKNSADRAVADQRRLLGIAESTLTATKNESAAVVQRQADQQAAAARAQALREGAGAKTGNQVTGQVGSCVGGDVSQYPNGQIPLSALCPIWGAAGQYLRADAAYAYDRLSHAYADRFGRPICVTDSYRSYASQVDLYARKPNLAAHPGTSNHGWGTAVDLCGGIQSFGTVTHEWMLVNAPLYGWFHPGWAEPSGSRPEPWHWEFGG
jgi:LAS superfamily LD-carboxypeptidase LdcB/cell division protein FtsB